MPQKLALALAIGLALALGLPSPTPVGAAPMMFGCGQEDTGVLSLWSGDPGWRDENNEHSTDSWFRWRIHGPGVDQVLHEGYMPTKRFETNARIWGLQGGKTYKIEYAEEIPGYNSYEADVLSCTVQGTSGLAFGFALTLDGTTPDYPKAPAATPTPAPTKPPATAKPEPTPDQGGGSSATVAPAPDRTDTAAGTTDGTSPTDTTDTAPLAVAPADDIATVAITESVVTTPNAQSGGLVSAAPGPYLVLLGAIGAVVGLLIVLAGRRKKEDPTRG